MHLIEEVSHGGDRTASGQRGAGLPPGHSEVGDTVRRGGLRGQDGVGVGQSTECAPLHAEITYKGRGVTNRR